MHYSRPLLEQSGGVFNCVQQTHPGHNLLKASALSNYKRITMTIRFKKSRILIVDDSIFIRDLIKSFYDEYGFDLIEAVNGREAVEMARSCIPDLILLDIHMPVMDGYESAVILKNDEAVKHIPILVVTGQEQGEVTELSRGMCDGYLGKPFYKADLIESTLQYLPGIKRNQYGDAHAEIA
jgi:two-component system, NarL family, sensor histidine kinase EvgS